RIGSMCRTRAIDGHVPAWAAAGPSPAGIGAAAVHSGGHMPALPRPKPPRACARAREFTVALAPARGVGLGLGCPSGQVDRGGAAPRIAASPPATAPEPPAPAPAPIGDAGRDHASFARPDEVVIVDLDLDLTVSFGERRVVGVATYRLD